MTNQDIFTIITGIISILSFMFAVWIWMKTDMKIKELKSVIKNIYKISATALWDENKFTQESIEVRLQQAGKTKGCITSLVKITEEYVENDSKTESMGINPLSYIIWTNGEIGRIETSKDTKLTWLITPDLQPDSSKEATGKMVNTCIKKGKKYVFFYPDNLINRDSLVKKLVDNIGLSGFNEAELRKVILTIPLEHGKYGDLFKGNGNTILFYSNENMIKTPKAFREIPLSGFPKRGTFWEKLVEEEADEIKYFLEHEYRVQGGFN